MPVVLMAAGKKRGHFSLSVIISATYFDKGKVLNMKIMNKLCFVCHTNPVSESKYKNKYEGTNGELKVSGVINIFSSSIRAQGIYNTKSLGDGESTAYQRVVSEMPYGPKISYQDYKAQVM
jgi:hypothetical protein